MGSVGRIIVKCKDLRVIQLDIPGMEECINIASSTEVKKKPTTTKKDKLESSHVLLLFIAV